MSDINSLGDAEALLTQAIAQDAGTASAVPDVPAPTPAQEPAAPAEPATQVTPDQPTEAPDLFADADIDLTNLTPAEELRLRQMQGHFTRKTQEAAAQRKEAEEALAFVTQLQNDPNYALRVHTELTQALQQAGLTPAQASQAATEQLQSQVAQQAETDDPFSDDEYWQLEQEPEYRVPPELQKQLSELQAWKEQQEAEQQRMMFAAQVDRETAAIRSENPTYTDEDMDAIYARAFAFDGDLRQAQQAFESDRNRIITAYLQAKASVPSGQPTSVGHAEAPRGFENLDQAHKAAMEHLARLNAEGLV